MTKDLKDTIARYVDEVGVENAIKYSVKGIDGILLMMDRPEHFEIVGPETDILPVLKFKLAIIEYLYFHPDTTKKAIEFGKTLI